MFRPTRLLAVALAIAVCGGVIAVPQPASAKPADSSPSARARATGQSVEVPELTSDRTRVLANPNGRFTAELSARPVRVRTATGWAAVDTTLASVGDVVKPKAAPLPVTLSGGGTGPLFTITRDGRTLSHGWPAPLPNPLLDKDIATYGEVLPGVDLKVRVTAEQVSYSLVVKNRAAAANPALRAIRVSMTGAEGFQLGEAQMWDSRQSTDPALVDRAEAARRPEDFVIAPRTGARTAKVATSATPGEMVLHPDENLLTGKDTVYPVLIDPPVNLNQFWSMINERFPNQSYWSYDRDVSKVGYVEDARDGWEKYRTLIQFDTRPLRGKTVNDVTMAAMLQHSYMGYDTLTDVYLAGAIGPGSTWNNYTGTFRDLLGSTPMSARNGAKYVEWKSEALNGKLRVAAIDWDNINLALASPDENVINKGWKKFDQSSFTLRVEYNSKPDQPRDLMIDDISACVRGADRPAVANTTPVLKGIASDADGGTLAMQGRIGEIGPDGKYDVEKNFRGLANWEVPSGTQAQISAGQLISGKSYWFYFVGKDTQEWGPNSPVCEFTVDTTKPDKKPIVATADGMYPNDGKQHGGVGKTGRFTFGSNGTSDNGVNDVAGYRYGLADPPTDYVAADRMGGSATAGVTPENRNMNRLFVRSVDRAGNMGPVETYQFLAGRGTDPIGQWNLDEKSGTTLADSSGKDRPATLSGGTSFTDSRTAGSNGAVRFNGSTGYAATEKPVIAPGTNFSAAAWVRLNADGTFQTAVAQDGARGSGMYLQYSKGRNRWSFTLTGADVDNPPVITEVLSDSAPRLGVWTHLAGTFDAANKVARLYVNARKVGESAVANPWAGAGALTIGRAKANGSFTDFWTGDLDDVRVWDRRIYESEIAEIVDQSTLVGSWTFDERAGRQAADSSGLDRALSLKDGAKWTDGHSGGAVFFTGNSWAETRGPVLQTDNSYTVSAWTRLDRNDRNYSVLAQDGNRTVPFDLQYLRAENRWALSLIGPDTDSGLAIRAVAAEQPKLGEWTHLTAVYDVRRQQVRLYVNGQLAATATATESWQANGPFVVGRAKWQGVPVDQAYAGAIDEVRAYQGVLSDAEILDLSRQ
ncbi:LamG domain-containing protein [Pseudonocardiaceae bacterium YIM PH 21723]|nr:LamG domain-containing protein [Pseudonocardiaceae bacterium YIM PH 21723]